VCRVLRLTLLAPEIVERILDGRPTAGLAQFLKPFPVEWERHREHLLNCRRDSSSAQVPEEIRPGRTTFPSMGTTSYRIDRAFPAPSGSLIEGDE
jgi:hypothetical protein